MISVDDINSKIDLSIVTIASSVDNKYYDGYIEALPKGCECILLLNEQANDESEIGKMVHLEDKLINCSTIKIYKYLYAELNFAVLRNVAKSLATRKWILSLDMDERLHYLQTEFDRLSKVPESVGGVMITLTSTKFIKGSNPSIESFQALRLFRNIKKFQWTKYVHEQIIDSIINNGYQIATISINIKHLGYEDYSPAVMIPKQVRNITLSAQQLSINPDDKILWMQMLHSLNALNSLGWFDGNNN